jgi:uncharacterized membrane protein YphA (DoxX/SURF4 family)
VSRISFVRAAVFVYGIATIAVGIVDLVWGAFDPAHQPIQAFGDNVPGRQAFAYIAGVLLVAGGAAVLRQRTARFGAIVIAIVYSVFAIFWLPRFLTAPRVLGYTASAHIGVLAGVCLELVVIGAAFIVYAWASESGGPADRRMTIVRWVYGLSTIVFGLQHLTNVANNVAFVPAWMPFGQPFWVVFTGTCFVLAGIAILSGVLDVLAARLLALMFVVFSVVTLVPGLLAAPHDQANWGGNAYEILVAASVWILAEWRADAYARNRLHGR